MYLKLQIHSGGFEHEGRLIPMYNWLYVGEFNEIFHYKKLLKEFENPDKYFTEYIFCRPKFNKNDDEQYIVVIQGFDNNGKYHLIGTLLEAYLLNNDGKTMEKLAWNQCKCDVRVKK